MHDQLNEERKKDATAVKKALREAFGMSELSVYDAFMSRSWCSVEAEDETVICN